MEERRIFLRHLDRHMRMKLIYPSWPKLERQTEFHLPPHGPVVFAAEMPDEVDLTFLDENLEELDFEEQIGRASCRERV